MNVHFKKINIAGNYKELKEYKADIQSSIAELPLYWSIFVIGIWILQQPQINSAINSYSKLYKSVVLALLSITPFMLLIVKFLSICIRNLRTDYITPSEFQVINIDSEFRLNKAISDSNFRQYTYTFIQNHPIRSISIIGLIVSQIYYLQEFNRIIFVFKQIPILGSLYAASFSVGILIVILFLLDYILNIKISNIRRFFKIFVFIEAPVFITGEMIGLKSILINPILSYLDNYANFGQWLTSDFINLIFLLGVPISLIYIIGNAKISNIDEEICKCTLKNI